MRIMREDRVIARSVEVQGLHLLFRAEPDVPQNDLPLDLFGFTGREVTSAAFFEWVSDRCFPAERVDAKKLLDFLGLKKYDPIAIVRKTGARLTGIDDFWVDWENT